MKSKKQRLEEARSLVKKYASDNKSIVDEFICERRQAAIAEEKEYSENANLTLANKVTFDLDAAAWKKFNAALDCPPDKNPRLQDLLSRKPVWQK